ncbi:retinol-binding protein pinta-like [Linepithema humile]|uniref:retinol-binding protein pinta-like n=1 Tax=Linepithema humile TaxID=83485 RepID=UPI00351DF2E6
MLKLEVPTLKEVLKNSGGDEKLLEELLSKFRLWLKQQSHLPQDISDQRLKFFIYAVKFNFEKAKKNLDTLYTLRNLVPELFENFDPFSDDINLLHTYFQNICLPKLTPEGYRLYICRLIQDDSPMYNAWTILKYFTMIFETGMEEDIVPDIAVIWDCTGVTINQLLKYSPPMLKKFDSCMAAYSLRIKAVYFIHAPKYIDIFMNAAKSIFRAKLFNRIHVCKSGIESLYETIPKAILPAEYGGEEPSMDILTDMWRAKLAQQRDCLIKEGRRKTQESLRVNSIINPDELFGVPGTFRKLELD